EKDGGSKRGEWSVPLAKAVGRNGCVLCIEPNPIVADPLAATLQINNLSHAHVLKVALSDADGTGLLAITAGDSGLSRLTTAEAAGAVAVPLRSLDSLVSEHGLSQLDLVKIDVEGHERHVLHGAVET